MSLPWLPGSSFSFRSGQVMLMKRMAYDTIGGRSTKSFLDFGCNLDTASPIQATAAGLSRILQGSPRAEPCSQLHRSLNKHSRVKSSCILRVDVLFHHGSRTGCRLGHSTSFLFRRLSTRPLPGPIICTASQEKVVAFLWFWNLYRRKRMLTIDYCSSDDRHAGAYTPLPQEMKHAADTITQVPVEHSYMLCSAKTLMSYWVIDF